VHAASRRLTRAEYSNSFPENAVRRFRLAYFLIVCVVVASILWAAYLVWGLLNALAAMI
jgi:hypothetical protein